MDAIVAVETMEMRVSVVDSVVKTIIKVEDLVRKLQSLCSPAMILAPLLTLNGTSLSAVAPDLILIGGESALASA